MACLVLCILLVGSLVVEGLHQEALSNSPIVSGLEQQLQEAFPEEPTLAVQGAIASGLMKAMSDEGMDVDQISCVRDYSRLCPAGWTEIGDGGGCLAPRNYEGTCKELLQLGGLSAIQKQEKASRCDAAYPCLGACTQDYTWKCPLGWELDVSQECLAPADYAGPCVRRKSYTGMKASEKESWSKLCSVTWPCHKTRKAAKEIDRLSTRGSDCLPDYSSPCPEGFMLQGQWCQSPVGVGGNCGSRLGSAYSKAEKAVYGEECSTPWPCAEPLGMMA